jgi:hypothetical protein
MNLNMDEVRLLGLSAPQLIKMLREREERLLLRMYGEFKNGKLDQLAALSEFACLRDIQNDIQIALRRHTAQEENKHADTNSDN